MKKDNLRQFLLIAGTLIVMNIIKGWLLEGIFMSIFATMIGDDNLPAAILTVITSTVVVGILTTLPLYWGMRENAEERRRFLAHFSEQEYNRANLKAYLKSTKIARGDRIVFLLALIVVLIFRFANPLFFLMEFVIIFGIYLVFDHTVRRKLYDKWESERLHK